LIVGESPAHTGIETAGDQAHDACEGVVGDPVAGLELLACTLEKHPAQAREPSGDGGSVDVQNPGESIDAHAVEVVMPQSVALLGRQSPLQCEMPREMLRGSVA